MLRPVADITVLMVLLPTNTAELLMLKFALMRLEAVITVLMVLLPKNTAELLMLTFAPIANDATVAVTVFPSASFSILVSGIYQLFRYMPPTRHYR